MLELLNKQKLGCFDGDDLFVATVLGHAAAQACAKSRRALVLAVAIQVRGYWSFTLLSVPVLAAPVLAVPGQTECNWQLLPLLVLTGSPFSQVRGKRPPGLWTVAGSRVVGH